jgi:hypothetical protein
MPAVIERGVRPMKIAFECPTFQRRPMSRGLDPGIIGVAFIACLCYFVKC